MQRYTPGMRARHNKPVRIESETPVNAPTLTAEAHKHLHAERKMILSAVLCA